MSDQICNHEKEEKTCGMGKNAGRLYFRCTQDCKGKGSFRFADMISENDCAHTAPRQQKTSKANKAFTTCSACDGDFKWAEGGGGSQVKRARTESSAGPGLEAMTAARLELLERKLNDLTLAFELLKAKMG